MFDVGLDLMSLAALTDATAVVERAGAVHATDQMVTTETQAARPRGDVIAMLNEHASALNDRLLLSASLLVLTVVSAILLSESISNRGYQIPQHLREVHLSTHDTELKRTRRGTVMALAYGVVLLILALLTVV